MNEYAPKLRFKGFSDEWSVETLKKSRTQIIDCEHKTAPYVDSSEYLVVRTNNVRDGLIKYGDIRYTSSEGFHEWTKRATPTFGDILFTREAPAGESCLVPKGKKICLGQRMVLLKPKERKMSGVYLSHLLQTPKSRFEVKKLSIGTTVTRINIQDIYRIKLAYPKLVEQQKIADFLTSVDTKISQLTEKYRLLKDYKKGVIQQIFSQKIRFKDYDGKAFPEWDMFKLIDIAEPIKRKADRVIDNVMTISAGKGFLHQNDRFSQVIAGTSLNKYIHLKRGEFAYNRGNSKSYTYGCIYRLEEEEALIPFVYRSFKLSKGVEGFFAQLFTMKYLDKQLRRLISSSARMDGLLNIGEKDFYQVKVPFPCIEEQQKIAQFLQSLDKKIDAVNEQIEQTKLFKKGLLQQMFV